MHFEHLLLSALVESEDTADWSTRLQSRISAVAGDDAAMGVLGLGATHGEFRAMFTERATALDQGFVAPMDALVAGVRQADDALTQARRAVRGRQP